MADITWIKLRTNMFDDEKIRLIEKMPEGDSIIIIWVKLLAYAGKANCNGYIMINENIPMNIEQISMIFNRPFEKVKYAINVLENFGMIEVSENEVVSIINWDKHQNIEGMEKVKIQNKERQRKYREKQKQQKLSLPQDSNVTVTLHNAIEIDKEIDKEKDNNKDTVPVKTDVIPYQEIIEYLNLKTGKNYKFSTPAHRKLIKARWNEGYDLNDFRKVIDTMTFNWKDDNKMKDFLQPSTLFGNKFDNYLNQEKKIKNTFTNALYNPWEEEQNGQTTNTTVVFDNSRQLSIATYED